MGEFAIKVSPFGGEYGGEAMGGKDAGLRMGRCTYIGRLSDLYRLSSRPILLCRQSNIASSAELYRSQQLLREVEAARLAAEYSAGTLGASSHEVVGGALCGASRAEVGGKRGFPKIF